MKLTQEQMFEDEYVKHFPVTCQITDTFAKTYGIYDRTTVQVGWTMWQAAYALGIAEGKAVGAVEMRERCAKVCEGVNNFDNPMTAADCADAIRALKETT